LLKRIFDRKISDKNIKGYNAEEIKNWLANVKEIDSFKYYYYHPGSKFPAESKSLRNQPTEEVLSFLDSHFSESHACRRNVVSAQFLPLSSATRLPSKASSFLFICFKRAVT